MLLNCEHWELTQSTSFFSIQRGAPFQSTPGKHLTLAGHLAIGHPYVAGKVSKLEVSESKKPILVMDVPGWLMEEVLVPRKVTNRYSHPP